MIEVRDIADRLNAHALELCREFLPGGHRNGNSWVASNIWDSGSAKHSASLVVTLTGAHIGKWHDFGGASPGEEQGDMIDLLRIRLCQGDKKAAIQEAKERLGIHDPFVPGARAAPDPEEQRRRAEEARVRAEKRQAEELRDTQAKIKGARSLWLRGRPIKGTPGDAYLRARGLDIRGCADWPGSFRFHEEVYCKPEGLRVPALLIMAVTPDGAHVATHRIFLQNCKRRGWTKIDSANAKMILGPMGGAFIPINRGSSDKSMRDMAQGERVFMAEGPEKCIALRMLFPEARIVCGITLGNMGAIIFPESIGELVIAADRPGSPKELDAFEKVVARQQARGVTVRALFPPAPYKDIDEWVVATLAQSGTTLAPPRAASLASTLGQAKAVRR